MNTMQPIIDVTPIEYSSDRTQVRDERQTRTGESRASFHAEPQAEYRHQASWGYSPRFERNRPAGTSEGFAAGTPFPASPRSALSGIARIAVGVGLVLAGIPMLVLPGPGLLTMLAGTALAASGARKLIAPVVEA